MLKIGRYEIIVGRTFRVQFRIPTQYWHFLCFWVFREAKPNDVDKRQRFLIGTLMKQEGRQYRYYKAPRDLRKGEVVFSKDKEET